MGQKVNTLGFRKGITNFWENSWYFEKMNYNKNFFEDYIINLYLNCLLKRLKIKLERCIIRRLNTKLFLNFFYYRLYFIKIRHLKKRKRFLKIKKKFRYIKRFKKYKLIKFKRKIKNVNIKTNNLLLRKTRYSILLTKLIKYYNLLLGKKLRQKRYYLINILNKLNFCFNKNNKISIFCINLNKFLLINIKKKKLALIFKKVKKFKKNRAFFDTIMVLNISLLLKNPKFFSDYIAYQLYYIRKKYPPYFSFLKELLITFKDYKYHNYVKGFRLRIGGKVKGRKKNRADYFLISRGKLSLMSLNNLIYYSYSIARTRFGILGIKFWVSYNSDGKLFKK